MRARLLIVAATVAAAFAVTALATGDELSGEPAAIALEVNRNGFGEIFTMSASGADRHRLTPRPPRGTDAMGDGQPDWSPDGRRIAFSSTGRATREDDRDLEIYTMNGAGEKRRRLTRNRVADGNPAWSPDGKLIAFTRQTGKGVESTGAAIYVMRRDGTQVRRLTSRKGYASQPTWSPDGKRIAFSRHGTEERGEGSIHVMNADGSGAARLIENAYQPAWSPDGALIAFSSTRDQFGETCFHECQTAEEIYVANADGSNVRRITTLEADDSSPAWTADGRLLFVSDRSDPEDHENDVYAMNADGTCPTRLTKNGEIWDLEPDWNPAVKAGPALRC